MGVCIPKESTDADVLIWYEGQKKFIKSREISFKRLTQKAQLLCRQESFVLVSLSSAGNPLRLNDDSTWNNLLVAKNKDILIIMVRPEEHLKQFKVIPTLAKTIDTEYEVVAKNVAVLTAQLIPKTSERMDWPTEERVTK